MEKIKTIEEGVARMSTNVIKPIKIAILSCNHGHARGYYGLSKSPYYDLVGVSIAPGYKLA